jgi:hypothetical protein
MNRLRNVIGPTRHGSNGDATLVMWAALPWWEAGWAV